MLLFPADNLPVRARLNRGNNRSSLLLASGLLCDDVAAQAIAGACLLGGAEFPYLCRYRYYGILQRSWHGWLLEDCCESTGNCNSASLATTLHIKSNMSLQARRSRLRLVVRAAQSSADMHGKITAIQQVQEYSTSIFETSTLLLA